MIALVMALCAVVALSFGALVYVALAGDIPRYEGPYEDER